MSQGRGELTNELVPFIGKGYLLGRSVSFVGKWEWYLLGRSANPWRWSRWGASPLPMVLCLEGWSTSRTPALKITIKLIKPVSFVENTLIIF